MHKRASASLVGVLSLFAVASQSALVPGSSAAESGGNPPADRKEIVPPVAAEPAPRPSPREDAPAQKELTRLIAQYFDGNVGRRFYLQVDKPLYKPGETIWFRTWDLKARSLAGADTSQSGLSVAGVWCGSRRARHFLTRPRRHGMLALVRASAA